MNLEATRVATGHPPLYRTRHFRPQLISPSPPLLCEHQTSTLPLPCLTFTHPPILPIPAGNLTPKFVSHSVHTRPPGLTFLTTQAGPSNPSHVVEDRTLGSLSSPQFHFETLLHANVSGFAHGRSPSFSPFYVRIIYPSATIQS